MKFKHIPRVESRVSRKLSSATSVLSVTLRDFKILEKRDRRRISIDRRHDDGRPKQAARKKRVRERERERERPSAKINQ